MKLYYVFLSLTVTIVSSSFAQPQPNVELENTLTRPVYYSIGSPADRVLNKNLEILSPPQPLVKTTKLDKDERPVNVVAETLSENVFQAGVEILLSSKPGEAELFAFTPGKTVYVDIKEDKAKNVLLTPQSGTALSFWRKTERKYPLSNNVTQKDIASVSLTSHDIPAANPQAFLDIYGPRKSFYGKSPQDYIELQAEPRIILGIPAGTTRDKQAVHEVVNSLLQKWNYLNRTTDKEAVKKVFALILQASINLQ